jgi:hypothetical protein
MFGKYAPSAHCVTSAFFHFRAGARPVSTSRACAGAFLALLLLAITYPSARVQDTAVTLQRYLHRTSLLQSRRASSWYSNVPIWEGIFPAPYTDYRYTRLHAAVQSQQNTYRNGTGRFVSVLANIEGTSSPSLGM